MMTTNTSSVRSKAELIIETAAFLPLTAAALLGNTLVLTAIYRNLRLRTTAHYFIATLALTDLLSACISQPLTVSTLLSGQWLTGTVGCHIHGFFNSFLTYTSSYTMVLTAVNRYFKVVRPRLYPRYFTKMRVVSLLVSIWIINIVVVLAPVLGGWARFEFTDMFRACVVKFPPNREASWAGFEFTVFSLIPMITISFCYYKVSKTIQQHNHITLASLQARSTGMNVEEIRVTKTLFSLVFVFFACMFGDFIMVVVCRVVAGAILDSVGYTLIFLITLTTAVNPILYSCTSKYFRKEFQRIIKCEKSMDVSPLSVAWSRPTQRQRLSAIK